MSEGLTLAEIHGDCTRDAPRHACFCFAEPPCGACTSCHAHNPRPRVTTIAPGVWQVEDEAADDGTRFVTFRTWEAAIVYAIFALHWAREGADHAALILWLRENLYPVREVG